MLQAMRSGAKTWFAKIILGILALSFVGWGVQGSLFTQQDPDIIVVGDETVQLSEIDAGFRNSVNQMRGIFGPDFTLAQAVQLGLLDRTIDEMTDMALFNAFSNSMGLDVDDATIAAEIRRNPAFVGATGSFDRTTYEIALNQAGLTEAAFVEIIRDELVRNQVLGSVQRGLELPESYAKMLAAHRLEQRAVAAVRIDADAITNVPTPTADQLSAFYTDNLALFEANEVRAFDLIDISAPAIAAAMTVSEEDLLAEYEFQAPSLGTPERRSLLQVLVSDQAQAEALATAARAATSITQAASDLSMDAPVDLGTVVDTDLATEVSAAVFNASGTGIVGPVQSSFGWHVIEITDIQEANVPSFEDIRDRLSSQVASRLAEEMVFDVTTLVEEQLDEGLDLATIASNNDLPLLSLPSMDTNGQVFEADRLTLVGNQAADLGINAQDILQTVFETEAGLNSGVLPGRTTGYYVVHVNAIETARQLEQTEVTTRLLAEWQQAERVLIAQALASDIAELAKSGPMISENPAATVLGIETFSRGTPSEVLPSAVQALAFATEATQTVVSDVIDRSVFALQVREIIPASVTDIEAAIAEEQEARSLALSEDLFVQLRNQLRLDLGAVVDRQEAMEFYVTEQLN